MPATAGRLRKSRPCSSDMGIISCKSSTRSFASKILESHADLVVAAGGDGTVATAARVLAGRKIPLAILPLGTANNIARSLNSDGPLDTLVASWGHTEAQSSISASPGVNGASRSFSNRWAQD